MSLAYCGLACAGASMALGVACARPPSAQASVCARPKEGVVVTADRVGPFPAGAWLGALKQRCSAGDATLYDAVGWQAQAWVFPFAGARVLAVQSKHAYGDVLRDSEPADLWIAEGDSTRLADGRLVPRTLGELRSRYGQTIVDDNVPRDDYDGPHARSCRFPYLVFDLAVNDPARHVPDSARIAKLELSVPAESLILRACTR